MANIHVSGSTIAVVAAAVVREDRSACLPTRFPVTVHYQPLAEQEEWDTM